MKKTYFVLCTAVLLLSIQSCFFLAPVAVSNSIKIRKPTDVKFEQEELDQLQQTTTLFVLRDHDYAQKEAFERAIREVWTFTDIEFVFYDEISASFDGLYSYFFLDNRVIEYNHSLLGFFRLNSVRLQLFYPKIKEKKSGKISDDSPVFGHAYIQLEESFRDSLSTFEPNEVGEQLYRFGEIPNWTPEILALYLAEINAELEEADFQYNSYIGFQEREGLRKLSTDTLYIPDYLLSDSRINYYDLAIEKVMKKYKNPYRVLAVEELDQLLQSGENIYFLESGTIEYDVHYQRIWSTEYGRVYSKITRGLGNYLVLKIKGMPKQRTN
ncbi:MAG: hypothetical protein AAF433_12860 [Bacteroidota bacterium]